MVKCTKMKMPKQFISLKAILFAVLAAALFSAPVAGAVHFETATSENCAEEIEVTVPEHDHNEHDHADHAHQCGQCHVHILRGEPDASVFFGLAYDKERLLLNDGVLSLSLSTWFRPPRP